MAKDLHYLANVMPRYSQAIADDVKAFENEIALSVLAAVARATPVDVGTARSNWQLAVGSAIIGLRSAFSPFTSRWRKPYGAGGSIGETRNQAGVVWSASSALRGRRADQPIYIANNSPYIAVLNAGHSTQAPAGFVERGIQVGVSSAVTLFHFTNIEKIP